MKVLMLSTDRNALIPESEVRMRFASYGNEFEELHVIVLNQGVGERMERVGKNVYIYATNSWLKITSLFDAYRLGISLGKKHRVDVITSQDPFELGRVALQIKEKLGCKLHVQVHTDPTSPWFTKHDSKNKARLVLMKKVLLQADAVRVVSKRVKRGLMRVMPQMKEPSILPIVHGLPTMSAEKQKAPFPFTILCMGRLAPEKHFHIAINVLKKAQESFPGAGIVFVGDGSERARLTNYAAHKGVASSVKFVGWEQKPSLWFSKAHCLLHTGAYEGYGRVLVEASLARLPVVTTDVGIANDVFSVGQDMFICPVDDVACLTEGVKRLMNDVYLRETMPRNAYDKAAAHIAQYKNYATLFKNDIKRVFV